MSNYWKDKIIKAVDKLPPSVINLSKEAGSRSDFDLIDNPSDRMDPINLKPASVVVGIVFLWTQIIISFNQQNGKVW